MNVIKEVVHVFSIPTIDMTATGYNIVRLRMEAGLSVQDLQQIFGFSTPQAIYKWQRGETLPSVENLAALACALSVSIDEILAVECRGAGS